MKQFAKDVAKAIILTTIGITLFISAMVLTGCPEAQQMMTPVVSEPADTTPPIMVTQPPTVIHGSGVDDVSHRPSVRLVYFRPKNQPVKQNVVTSMRRLISDANRYYADEMQRHGFGRKTFAVETDSSGVPVVHSIEGWFKESYYRSDREHKRGVYKARDEFLERNPDGSQHIYFFAMDMTKDAFIRNTPEQTCAFGGLHFTNRNKEKDALGGYVVIPASGWCSENLSITIHELGHAFGLHHDFREGMASDLIMAYGSHKRLSRDAAEWLSVSMFFNSTISHNSPGDITLVPHPIHTPQGIQISFQAEDVDKLHQMQLLYREQTGYTVIDFKPLKGLTDVAEFVSPKLTQDKIILQIIDKRGGITQVRFPPIN